MNLLVRLKRQAVADGLDAGGIQRGNRCRGQQRIPGRDFPGGQRLGENRVENCLLRRDGRAVDAAGIDGCGRDLPPVVQLPRRDFSLGNRHLAGGKRPVRAHHDFVILAVRAGKHKVLNHRAQHVRLRDHQVCNRHAPGAALLQNQRVGQQVLYLRQREIADLHFRVEDLRHQRVEALDLRRADGRVLDFRIRDFRHRRRQVLDIGPVDVRIAQVRLGNLRHVRRQRADLRPVDVRFLNVRRGDLRQGDAGDARVQFVCGDIPGHNLGDIRLQRRDAVGRKLLHRRRADVRVLHRQFPQLRRTDGPVGDLHGLYALVGKLVAVHRGLEVGNFPQRHRFVLPAQRVPLVARHPHRRVDARALGDHPHGVVEVHGLQVRVLPVFLRLAQRHEVHIQPHRGQVYAVVAEIRLRKLCQLCACLRRVVYAVLPDLYVVLDCLRADGRVVADVRAVYIYCAAQKQRLAIAVLPHGDDARDHAVHVRGQRRAQQVLAVADGHAGFARLIRQNPDVKVIPHQPRSRLRNHAVVRVQQAFHDAPPRVFARHRLCALAMHVEIVRVERALKELPNHGVGGCALGRVFVFDHVAQQVVKDVPGGDAHFALCRVPLHGNNAEKLHARLHRVHHPLRRGHVALDCLGFLSHELQVCGVHIPARARRAHDDLRPAARGALHHHLRARPVLGKNLCRSRRPLAQVQVRARIGAHPVNAARHRDRFGGNPAFLILPGQRRFPHRRGRFQNAAHADVEPLAALIHGVRHGKFVHPARLFLDDAFIRGQGPQPQCGKVRGVWRVDGDHSVPPLLWAYKKPRPAFRGSRPLTLDGCLWYNSGRKG